MYLELLEVGVTYGIFYLMYVTILMLPVKMELMKKLQSLLKSKEGKAGIVAGCLMYLIRKIFLNL